MADEHPSDRDVHIESTVNVGTTNDRTTVSGAKVSIGSAREVHVHSDTTSPPSFRSVALVGVLAFLGAVLVNIATSQLPSGLQPYLWLAWPLALLVTAASIWVAFRQQHGQGRSPTINSPSNRRNRQAMLAKVKTIWIAGLLDQSLAKETRIVLGLTEQPDAVDLSLKKLVQELNRPARELPTGTPIINVFDQMGGTLLILGAPGAGKTTLLLELARDLIARAEGDENFPIPVVFNLSPWAEKRTPLKDWLVEELNQRYDVPKKTAQGWVDTDALLPLLDGLDEVAVEHRSACVEVINTYRQECGLVSLAICSRVVDYEALTVKLRLQGAVRVQPLSQQQIGDYLEWAGDKLVGVRAALRDDTELAEMLDTPLMLSIVVLAYAGKSAAEVQSIGTSDDWRRHLFDACLTAMLTRRGVAACYTSQQTINNLSWLAMRMVQHSQTVYYIERMQPDWLSDKQHHHYERVVRLLSGLPLGLVGGLFFGLLFGLGGYVRVGIGVGLCLGLFFGLIGGQGEDFRFLTEHIKIKETLRWSRPSDSLFGLGVAFGIGLVGALGIGLVLKLGGGLGVGLFWGLVSAGCVGMVITLAGGLDGYEVEARMIPNQGIRRSAQSGLIGGLIDGLIGGLVGGLIGGLGDGLVVRLIGGLIGGLVCGLAVGGLDFGGGAVVQHYTLRWMLSRNGVLPFRDQDLIPFLDYCAERIFLRKVGGGYIFIHRLLMEHFASLYAEQPTAPPK